MISPLTKPLNANLAEPIAKFTRLHEATCDLALLELQNQIDPIMKLPSFSFDKFPDGTANRLHQYNIFKFDSAGIKKLAVELHNWLRLEINKTPLWITGWINFMTEGQSLGWHSHEEDEHSLYSGTVSLLPSDCRLILCDTSTDRHQEIMDSKGQVVIFSSATRHSTTVSPGPRMTVAFDVRTGPRKSELWTPL